MIAVMSLLWYINGSLQNQLYLLSAIPKSIANKADVSSEFCWGKNDDCEVFLKLIKSGSDSSRYDQSNFYYYEPLTTSPVAA